MSAATGGPAFPQLDCDGGVFAIGGMTLRDYFAGQALGGMLASVRYDGNNAANVDAGNFAKGAYAMADAMLAERAK